MLLRSAALARALGKDRFLLGSHGRGARGMMSELGPFATGLSPRQVRASSAMPRKRSEFTALLPSEVYCAFALTLQSEYPTATQQE
jgi:hypothetical protein